MKREIKVGLFAIAVLLIGWGVIKYLKGIDVFSSSNVYYAYYDQVGGIQPASHVMIYGVKVGTVTNVTLNEDPTKGVEVELTLDNLPLYERIITSYEGNNLEVRDGVIYINSEEAHSYTFKQDYYFMMGDNRHNSLDSRYWGFVPEDHIVGKPAVIWLSIDRNRKFPHNIRWRRFFKFV